MNKEIISDEKNINNNDINPNSETSTAGGSGEDIQMELLKQSLYTML